MKPITPYDLSFQKIEDFSKVLSIMPSNFSSSQYKKACLKNGLVVKEHGGVVARILKSFNCVQAKPGSKFFYKTSDIKESPDPKYCGLRKLRSDIFDKAYEAMENEFTSYHFADYLRKNYGDRDISYNSLKYQLKKRGAIQNGFNGKSWKKKTSKLLDKEVNIPQQSNILSIEQAIILLKNNGYKILKPKTDWQEL